MYHERASKTKDKKWKSTIKHVFLHLSFYGSLAPVIIMSYGKKLWVYNYSLALTLSSDALASSLMVTVRLSGPSPKKITSTVTSSLGEVSGILEKIK